MSDLGYAPGCPEWIERTAGDRRLPARRGDPPELYWVPIRPPADTIE